jgi:hypothetical protein
LNKTITRLGLNKYYHERISVDLGDILRIDGNGNMKKEKFKAADSYHSRYNYYQYPMYMYELDDGWNLDKVAASEYLDNLKQISGLYGYTPDDIDGLVEMGWTLEDIEYLLYDENIYCESMLTG